MVAEVGHDDMNVIKCSYVQYSFVGIPWHACLLVKHCQFQCCERRRPINVVGNVKQVTIIILSVFLFKNKMKPIGILGSIICISGSMWYTYGGI